MLNSPLKVCVFSLISLFIKEKLYIGEASKFLKRGRLFPKKINPNS